MNVPASFILSTIIVLGLFIVSGCSGPPDEGHVGPIGPVGPQGEIGPQDDLIVIEHTCVMVTKNYSYVGFTRLEISDGFDVMVSRGSDYSVGARFEETVIPYIQVSQQDDTLIIMLEPGRAYNMVNITMDVDITMPQLTEIILRDGADVTVTGLAGFESDVDFLSNLNIE